MYTENSYTHGTSPSKLKRTKNEMTDWNYYRFYGEDAINVTQSSDLREVPLVSTTLWGVSVFRFRPHGRSHGLLRNCHLLGFACCNAFNCSLRNFLFKSHLPPRHPSPYLLRHIHNQEQIKVSIRQRYDNSSFMGVILGTTEIFFRNVLTCVKKYKANSANVSPCFS